MTKKAKANRILIAGTGSGCGKTTVTLALLCALKKRGLSVSAAKCGPDYIDPMFHRSVVGTSSVNLDPFFFDADTLKALLAENAADLTVVEGVMGYYDGVGMTTRASAYELARLTETPAVLVVNARGAALSVLAQIKGFLDLMPESHVKGVILNNCTEKVASALAPLIRERLGIEPLGCMPRLPACELGSRHLGLITAPEIEDLKSKLSLLAQQAEKTVDLDGLVRLASSAEELTYTPLTLPRLESVRIAVARDRAFCFYYEESLAALEKMGAQLVPFSPLEDAHLPGDIHGLILGGGYPELYAEALSRNTSLLREIRLALENGLPCIAECGGFMYLTERIAGFPAVGFIRGASFDAGGLQRFGYITLTANEDGMLLKTGESVPAHEFHRWDCENTGSACTAQKPDGRSWPCVFTSPTLYAGFPHLHLLADPRMAERFIAACIKEKSKCQRP